MERRLVSLIKKLRDVAPRPIQGIENPLLFARILGRVFPETERADGLSALVANNECGGHLAITTDAEDTRGAKSHTARTASLDGKEVTVDTNNPSVKETYTRINDRSFQRVMKVNGQVRNTLKATLSADGHSFTIDATGTNVEGKQVHNTTVFDKQ